MSVIKALQQVCVDPPVRSVRVCVRVCACTWYAGGVQCLRYQKPKIKLTAPRRLYCSRKPGVLLPNRTLKGRESMWLRTKRSTTSVWVFVRESICKWISSRLRGQSQQYPDPPTFPPHLTQNPKKSDLFLQQHAEQCGPWVVPPPFCGGAGGSRARTD